MTPSPSRPLADLRWTHGLASIAVVAIVLASGLSIASGGAVHGGRSAATGVPRASEARGAFGAPNVVLLAGYNGTQGAVQTAYANFTVGAAGTAVFYLWSAGANGVPHLPGALHIAQAWNSSTCCSTAGIALGLLGPGTYTTSLFANVTNGAYTATEAVSVAVYGLANGGSYSYYTSLAAQQTNLSMPSGGSEFLAALSSGGQRPISSSSLTTIDEASPAYMGGTGDYIGRQTANFVSMVPVALLYAIAAVGIYPLGSLNEVDFSETGLAAGTNWTVAFGGQVLATTGTTIAFQAENGTYPYTVPPVFGYGSAPSAGNVTVAGAGVIVPVAFRSVPIFNVTFSETGLAPGVPWSVTFDHRTNYSTLVNGSNNSSSSYAASIGVRAPNGTYPFAVVPPTDYTVAPDAGNVTVGGADAVVPLVFHAEPLYAVTVAESGLPPGAPWTVYLSGGPSAHSVTGTAAVHVPNGTYALYVYGPAGYRASPANFSVVVNGTPVNLSVGFASSLGLARFLAGYNGFEGAVQNAKVNFTIAAPDTEVVYLWAAGADASPTLPVGLSVVQAWNSSTCCATVGIAMGLLGPGSYATSLALVETNGAYTATIAASVAVFGIPNGSDYSYGPRLAPMTDNLTMPAGGLVYLAAMTSGGQRQIFASSLDVVVEASPAYLGGEGDLIGAQSSDQLWMNPEALLFGIAAVGVYPAGALTSVTFNETGLPPGTNWSVTLDGVTGDSQGGSVSFAEPIGSYAFSVGGAAGWRPNPASGTVAVSGSPVRVNVTFVRPPEVVTLLGGYNGTAGAVRYAYVNFTVTAPDTEVFYLWAAGATGLPSVPSGLASVEAWNSSSCCASAGLAMGLLAPGAYTTSLFVNVTNGLLNATRAVSVEVYALPNASGYAFDSALAGQSTNLTLPGGGLVYLAALSSGGERPIDASSLATVDQSSPAYLGGFGDDIGRQYSGAISMTVEAYLFAVAGVGIYRLDTLSSVNTTEFGLPGGTPWSESFGGVVKSTDASSLAFGATNGTYAFEVGTVAAGPGELWVPTPRAGVLDVHGPSIAQSISFHLAAADRLTFLEKGLPIGANWSVASGPSSAANTTVAVRSTPASAGAVVFEVPSGALDFRLIAPPGYGVARIAGPGAPNQTSGNVGGATVWTVTFGRLVSVWFNESAVPAASMYPGARWSVTLTPLLSAGGPAARSATTTGRSVEFTLPAGAGYRIGFLTPGGEYRAVAPRAFVVPAHGLAKTVPFRLLTQAVVLRASGLASGSWSVTIRYGSTAALSYPIVRTGLPTAAVRFALPLGAYAYTVSATDGQTAAAGTIEVLALPAPPQVIRIAFA